jgi:hypothetical protein
MKKERMMMMEMVRKRKREREGEGRGERDKNKFHMYSFNSSEYKTFKNRDDFLSIDDYARYVKENIKVGMMVKCCEAYEEVRHGDIGRVMKVSTKSETTITCMYDLSYVCRCCMS